MRNSTKAKIVNWVKLILKYKDPIDGLGADGERKIREVRWEHLFHNHELVHGNAKRLNRIVVSEITSELQRLDFIKIKTKPEKDGYKISASAFFLDPAQEV